MREHIIKHYFFYTIIALFLVSAVASYYRFMVSYEYLVRYEGDCNPNTQSCYIYCEDDECAEPFYYSWVTASAQDIRQYCDDDVTVCDYAFECIESGSCEVEFCNNRVEECSSTLETNSNI